MAVAYIYYTILEDLETPLSPRETENLPVIFQEEINGYKKQDDKIRIWAGKKLLMHLLEAHGYPVSLAANFVADALGRPYIEGVPDFNITHSGQIVAIVSMLGPKVGIDVEKIRPMDVKAFVKVFSEPEIAYIENHARPMEAFFECWTQKESVMKADGRGMRIPLHNICLFHTYATITDREETWHLYPFFAHPAYKSHICSPEPVENILSNAIDLGRS